MCAFPRIESTEEGEALDAAGSFVDAGRLLSGCGRRGQVGDDARLEEAPSLVTHPSDHVRTWADDDVRELDRGLLEKRHPVCTRQDADLAPYIGDPPSRPVAEHDEERLGECKTELPQAQRDVGRSRQVLRDDDVRWVVPERKVDGVRVPEVRRLDRRAGVRPDW